MYLIVALVCAVVASPAAATDDSVTYDSVEYLADVSPLDTLKFFAQVGHRYGRGPHIARKFGADFIQEAEKSKDLKQIFEIVASPEFMHAECSWQTDRFLVNAMQFIQMYFPVKAAQFNALQSAKIMQCAAKFDEMARRMSFMMFEWSMNQFFKRTAHIQAKRPDHSLLLQAAKSFNFDGLKDDARRNEACRVAAAMNRLRREQLRNGYEPPRMIKGEIEVEGSALVLWPEYLDKFEAEMKDVNCDKELVDFFEETCHVDLMKYDIAFRFAGMAVALGYNPNMCDRARKYGEYKRICYAWQRVVKV